MFRTDRRTFQLFGGPLTRDAPNSHATTTDRGPINHLICTLARGQERSWETGKGDLNSWHVVCVPSGAKSRRTLSNCLTFRWSSWTHQPTTTISNGEATVVNIYGDLIFSLERCSVKFDRVENPWGSELTIALHLPHLPSE